mgnify:CR=1 FL=1
MTEPIIYKVDSATYHSGQMIDSLRFYYYNRRELKFFDAKCNWTWNTDTLRYYQILAEDQRQAESLAKQTYAREFHISTSFVEVVV